MDAARSPIGLFTLLGVAQESRYQHRVNDTDDAERHDEDDDQRDKVDVANQFRIGREAKIEIATQRLIGAETRIGARSFVLDRDVVQILDDY